MKCKECGQEYDPNENPKFRECPKHGMFRIGPVMPRPGVIEDEHVVCGHCGKSFGSVRQLIEKAALWNLYGSAASAADLIATLTRERDEAKSWSVRRARYADDVTSELVAAKARIEELERNRDSYEDASAAPFKRGVRLAVKRIRQQLDAMFDEVKP